MCSRPICIITFSLLEFFTVVLLLLSVSFISIMYFVRRSYHHIFVCVHLSTELRHSATLNVLAFVGFKAAADTWNCEYQSAI